jgi:hypothetical protein
MLRHNEVYQSPGAATVPSLSQHILFAPHVFGKNKPHLIQLGYTEPYSIMFYIQCFSDVNLKIKFEIVYLLIYY